MALYLEGKTPLSANPDEVSSVLIARLMREVQHFVENSLIQEGTSADEVWSRFLENLNNGKTSALEVGERPKNRPSIT